MIQLARTYKIKKCEIRLVNKEKQKIYYNKTIDFYSAKFKFLKL